MIADLAVDELLQRLKQGDETAAAAIFDRFARRLIGLARGQLDLVLRQKVDPEDIVQSVFRSFFRRQQQGQFELAAWDSLWSLLAMITVRKCTNMKVAFGRQARNVRREVREKAKGADSSFAGYEMLGREPTPAEAAVLREMVERLLASLPDRDRQIVALNLEGKSNREISAHINRAERTVRRTLDQFRAKLETAVFEPSTIF